MRNLLVGLTMAVAACGTAAASPAFAFGANTPDDLRILATETLDLVAAALPNRVECLEGITLTGAWELEDRARYQPDGAEIILRIPATAPQLQTSMVHELAHHLEFACPPQTDVRPSFLAAQGFPAGTDWFDGDTWETTPSEHWASAVVIHVLGSRDERSRISIESRAIAVIRDWAGST